MQMARSSLHTLSVNSGKCNPHRPWKSQPLITSEHTFSSHLTGLLFWTYSRLSGYHKTEPLGQVEQGFSRQKPFLAPKGSQSSDSNQQHHSLTSCLLDLPTPSLDRMTLYYLHWLSDASIQDSYKLIDQVKVLRPTQHKTGHFGDVPPSQSLGKKLNLTQQKHAFINQKKGTATQNKQKLKLGLVTSYNQYPSWKLRGPIISALHKSVTYFLTHLATYLQPRDPHGASDASVQGHYRRWRQWCQWDVNCWVFGGAVTMDRPWTSLHTRDDAVHRTCTVTHAESFQSLPVNIQQLTHITTYNNTMIRQSSSTYNIPERPQSRRTDPLLLIYSCQFRSAFVPTRPASHAQFRHRQPYGLNSSIDWLS